MIDNLSEPGSWKREMEKLPWRYGQTQNMKLETALANLRGRGLFKESMVIEQEIKTLQAELTYVRHELEELRHDYPVDFESKYRGR